MGDRLREIKERLAEITPGPWAWMFTGEKSNGWAMGTWQFEDETWVPAGAKLQDYESDRYEAQGEPDEVDHAMVIDQVCESFDGNNYNDAQFISEAPGDIAWLVARVEELEHHLNPRPAARPPKTGEYATY